MCVWGGEAGEWEGLLFLLSLKPDPEARSWGCRVGQQGRKVTEVRYVETR